MKKYIAAIVALVGLGVASFAETIPLDTTLTFNINLTEVDGSYQPSTAEQNYVMAQVYSNLEVGIAGHSDISHARVRVRVSADQIKVLKEEICQQVLGQSYTQELYEGLTLSQLRTAIIGIARTKFLAAMSQQ